MSFWLKALGHGLKAAGYAMFDSEAADEEITAREGTPRKRRKTATRKRNIRIVEGRASVADGGDSDGGSCCTARRGSVPPVRRGRGGT